MQLSLTKTPSMNSHQLTEHIRQYINRSKGVTNRKIHSNPNTILAITAPIEEAGRVEAKFGKRFTIICLHLVIYTARTVGMLGITHQRIQRILVAHGAESREKWKVEILPKSLWIIYLRQTFSKCTIDD